MLGPTIFGGVVSPGCVGVAVGGTGVELGKGVEVAVLVVVGEGGEVAVGAAGRVEVGCMGGAVDVGAGRGVDVGEAGSLVEVGAGRVDVGNGEAVGGSRVAVVVGVRPSLAPSDPSSFPDDPKASITEARTRTTAAAAAA